MTQNGLIPLSNLTPLSVGGYLTPAAANSFERWRKQAASAGRTLTITSAADAYRDKATQKRIFLARYVRQSTGGGYYGDVRYFEGHRYVRTKGNAAAAVPGTSNHGWGLAVDIQNAGAFGGSFHSWMSATGPSMGWTNTEGKSVNEPWHWVYDPHLDRGQSTGGNAATIPNPSEDDMTPDQAAQLARIENLLTVPGMPFGYPAATHNAIGRLIEEGAAQTAVINQVASKAGVDPEVVRSAVNDAVGKALSEFELTLTTKK